MLKHKFATGDRVLAMPGSSYSNLRPGVYTILRLLPVVGHGCQYRAKNVTDTYDRVLDEAMLRLANA